MWVLLFDWMVDDKEPPMPSVGGVLTGLGVRLRGDLVAMPRAVPDGITEHQEGAPHQVTYRVAGTVGEPRDVWVEDTEETAPQPKSWFKRRSRGSRHAGCDFAMTTRGGPIQVHVDAEAQSLSAGSRLAVEGRFVVVGAYEWEAFDLTDTRADWLVKDIATAPHGDVVLDLHRVP